MGNVPTKREQCQTCLGNAERAEQVTKAKPKGNVPNLRFPEFSGEWKKCTIDDLCEEFKSGKNIKADNILNEGEYPVFGGNGLRGYTDCYNHEGDYVLIGRQGALCGNIRFVTGKTYITEHAIAAKATNNNNTRFLESLFIQLNLGKFSDQSAQPGLAVNKLLKIETSVPSKDEQEKIASLLQNIDKRIATQNKIIDKLQSLIKGIGDKLLFNDTWTTTRLCDILTERIEKSKTNNQHEVLSSTVKGIYSQREYFSKDIASENNVGYKIIYLHDIVLSPQNLWMGNINYNNKFDVGIVSPSYKIYKVSSKFDKHFIASILKTHRALYNYQLVSEQGASVVRRNLNMEAFEQLTFKMPPYDLQVKIGLVISLLQKQLDIAFATKQVYDQQKQYLLSQIFI